MAGTGSGPIPGALHRLRSTLRYYPRDAWYFQMAGAWARIGQEEHLMGRAGIVGDELGSALIASRIVLDIMRLCFYLERRFAPYPKWFGTAFRELECGPELYPTLQRVLTADTWPAREAHLLIAYERIAAMHNRLGITKTLPQKPIQFFGRPFRVIAINGFADELLGEIEGLSDILRRSPIGGIDQISDNTDFLEETAFRKPLERLFGNG